VLLTKCPVIPPGLL